MSRKKFPRRGNVLSKLFSAFRLTRKGDTESGTVKRIHGDKPEVSEEEFVNEIRRTVAKVLPNEYLAARGLTRSAAEDHQRLVATALDQVLQRWDYLASVIRNTLPSQPQPPLPILAVMLGIVPDILGRAAAYDHLYGELHPVRDALPMLVRKPGLKEWWTMLERRFGKRLSTNELVRRTRVAKATIKRARSGEAVDGGVIAELANGLAKKFIGDQTASRIASAAEIEFEMRATLAAHEVLRFARKVDPAEIETWVRQFRLFRLVVEDLDRPDVLDLLERGIESPAFSRLQGAAAAGAHNDVLAMTAHMAAEAAAVEQLFERDPTAALRWIVARTRSMSAELQHLIGRDDDATGLMAEYLAHTADFYEAMIERKPLPQSRRGFLDEFRAATLVMSAINPRERKPIAEQERLLREAVDVNPRSTDARGLLSRVLIAQGRTEEAIEHLRETARLAPSDPVPWYSLVNQLIGLDRWQDVLDAVGEGPADSLELVAIRGYALAKLGRLQEGRDVVEGVLKQDKTSVAALEALAFIEGASYNNRRASTLARHAWFHVGPRRSWQKEP